MKSSEFEIYSEDPQGNNANPVISSKAKTVIILGMHRSGTSLTAGVVNKLGVNVGERLLGKCWTNPLGHFEDEDFIQLNARILESAGGTWDNPPAPDKIYDQKNRFENEIKDLLRAKNRNNLWGWKDPRTSLTIELYMPYIRKPHIIVCHRDWENIIKSLKRRSGMTEEYARNLIKMYETRTKIFIDQHHTLPVLHVSYEDFLKRPETMISRIITFLGLEQNKENYLRAISFVRPNEELRRISNFMRMQNEAKQFFLQPAKRFYYFFKKRRRKR